MILRCPICMLELARPYRGQAIDGGRVLSLPAMIHFCPTVQPEPANDAGAGNSPEPTDPPERRPAPVLSMVRP